jgi:hypothetical protein
MRSLARPLSLLALSLVSAASAQAATISVVRTNNSTCLHSQTNNSGTQEAWNAAGCQNPGTLVGETQYMNMNDSGNVTSPSVVVPPWLPFDQLRTGGVVTSVAWGINASISTDDVSGDSFVRGQVRYSLTITVDADRPSDFWEVDLSQSVLGLLALKGDGTASAVGTQSSGESQISAITVTALGGTVNTTNLNFTPSGGSLTGNPSNNSSQTQQFSGSRADINIADGFGDAVFTISIAYDLDAFSNDGCSGFICSSISGGEEVAVLNGFDNPDTVSNPSADQYGTWGRSVGPDGYNAIFTLYIPEPGTLALLASGLLGLAVASRRRA